MRRQPAEVLQVRRGLHRAAGQTAQRFTVADRSVGERRTVCATEARHGATIGDDVCDAGHDPVRATATSTPRGTMAG
jgi:hypothetical protein